MISKNLEFQHESRIFDRINEIKSPISNVSYFVQEIISYGLFLFSKTLLKSLVSIYYTYSLSFMNVIKWIRKSNLKSWIENLIPLIKDWLWLIRNGFILRRWLNAYWRAYFRTQIFWDFALRIWTSCSFIWKFLLYIVLLVNWEAFLVAFNYRCSWDFSTWSSRTIWIALIFSVLIGSRKIILIDFCKVVY